VRQELTSGIAYGGQFPVSERGVSSNPRNQVVDREPVRALRFRRSEGIQDSALRVIKIRDTQDAFQNLHERAPVDGNGVSRKHENGMQHKPELPKSPIERLGRCGTKPVRWHSNQMLMGCERSSLWEPLIPHRRMPRLTTLHSCEI
jgi:hypothetical protein